MGKMTRPDETGDGTDQLVAAVYAELRRIAAAQMARLPAGSTLQPTALVHEAWLRLEKSNHAVCSDQAHFFAAAAEAMRHILIDRARRRNTIKHGAESRRVSIVEADLPLDFQNDDHLLALDSAIQRLAEEHPDAAELIKLHCFAGMEVEDAGRVMGLTRATAYRRWLFARTWLHAELTS
jgi:RNA polymerase sigma factor (TIGR02999 family)